LDLFRDDALPFFSHLELIDFTKSDISNRILCETLYFCTALKTLTVSKCFYITEAVVNSSVLEKLIISECNNLLTICIQCPKIASSDLSSCIRLSRVEIISCPELQTVTFSDCSRLARPIIQDCPNLTDIQLSRTDVTEDIVNELASNCPLLKRAELILCNKVKNELVQASAAGVIVVDEEPQNLRISQRRTTTILKRRKRN